jgi:hypothetical protein
MLWVQQAVRSRRIDLRKIAGEENPADLFTKHLVSREKVGLLVKLLRCKYMTGRAESAPAVRQGTTQKVTIGDADLRYVAEGRPRMPHLDYNSKDDLDKAFPSLSVPTEVGDNHESMWDSWDKLYLRGQEIFEKIKQNMDSSGRRRCEKSEAEGQ